MTKAELRAEIARLEPWFQGIQFTDSIRVGVWDTEWLFRTLFDGISLAGKTLLDIGAMSGGMSLLAEWAGAAVTAIEPDQRSFRQLQLVKEWFGLDMRPRRGAAADLTPDADVHDVVLLAGVYYHTIDPVGTIQRAWACTRELLVVEGEVSGRPGCSADFYAGEYKGDGTNWWVPTVGCLLAWLQTLEGRGPIALTQLNESRAMARVVRA